MNSGFSYCLLSDDQQSALLNGQPVNFSLIVFLTKLMNYYGLRLQISKIGIFLSCLLRPPFPLKQAPFLPRFDLFHLNGSIL